MFLATTALSEFWDKQQELLLLGPWCRRQDRRGDWAGLRAKVLPSPWEDRKEFHHAAEYLDTRMEQILPSLADCLNKQLGHSGSLRYWRILTGTWLLHSMHATYDRYIHLSQAFKKHPHLKTLLLDPASFRTPADARQMVDWIMADDRYNLQIISQLLAGMGRSFPAKQLSDDETGKGPSAPERSFKRMLRGTLEGAQSGLWHLLGRNSSTRLVEMYCPGSVQLQLCWKTRFQVAPWILPSREGEAPSTLKDHRRSALSMLPAPDEFMQLWVRSLPDNFPTLYLEGFQCSRQRALRRLRRPPRTLVSATGWHYSEPFKFLAAELSERGGRLVAVQHGSGYNLFRSMPMEQHERRISDSFLGWEEAPPLQLVASAKRSRAPALRPSVQNRLLYVATTNPRYPFRFYSAPQAHQVEDYFKWQARFLESLGPSLRSKMVVRLHPLDFGQCLRERLSERFPDLCWDKERSFSGSALRSRLLVVDHPGTSMLAALAQNRPTLLFWDPQLWEFKEEGRAHLELLRQAGLFHADPPAAARVLGEILLEGPDRWWRRPPVQKALRRFTDRYAPVPEDWLNLWSKRLLS